MLPVDSLLNIFSMLISCNHVTLLLFQSNIIIIVVVLPGTKTKTKPKKQQNSSEDELKKNVSPLFLFITILFILKKISNQKKRGMKKKIMPGLFYIFNNKRSVRS